ncbi:MAG: Transcriptional regulatory protein TdiR [Planctomycetota bacterium]|jgi:FixJ family two-component response regulator
MFDFHPEMPPDARPAIKLETGGQADPGPGSPAPGADPQPAGKSRLLRVYAVDDDPNVLTVLRAMLKQAGYDVVCFPSAVSFLAELPNLPRGMVITDQVMPGMTGLELHQQLRTLRPLDFRLILITAFPRTSLTVEAMKLGAITVLDKPFDRNELLQAVLEGFVRLDTIGEPDYPLPPPLPDGKSYLDLLSARELEVILMVYHGSTNKSISIRLGLSIKTVEKHRARGMRKMKVTSLAGLVRLIDREVETNIFPRGRLGADSTDLGKD